MIGDSLFHWLVTKLHQSSDCCGGSVEQIHLVLLDHLPVAAVVGVERRALKLMRGIIKSKMFHVSIEFWTYHDGGGSIGEGTVDNVCVPSNPTNVGGAPVDVAWVVVKDVFEGGGCVQQIASCCVENAFWLPSRTTKKTVYRNLVKKYFKYMVCKM
jgi:hypothetical protein